MIRQPRSVMRLVPVEGIDRRVHARHETRAMALVKRLDHAIAALQNPRMTVALRDLSVGGLAAISGVPVTPGERLEIRVMPEGIQHGWETCGRVVRCDPSGLGYRVAVAFDPVPVAA